MSVQSRGRIRRLTGRFALRLYGLVASRLETGARVPRMPSTARMACGDVSETDGAISGSPQSTKSSQRIDIGRIQMKRFEPSTPRAAAVVAALTMTLITFGLAIVAPAALDAYVDGDRAQATNPVSPAAH